MNTLTLKELIEARTQLESLPENGSFEEARKNLDAAINAKTADLIPSIVETATGPTGGNPSQPPADPGEGCRLLEVGEVIEKGDEIFYEEDDEWHKLSYLIGDRVLDAVIRRKIKKPPTADQPAAAQKPPIGLRPDYIWHEQRAKEIYYAIGRYLDRHRRPPQEWLTELSDRIADAFPEKKEEAPAAEEVVDPGEGYRLLEIGEKIQKGDDFWNPHENEWVGTHEAGNLLTSDRGLSYRRKP